MAADKDDIEQRGRPDESITVKIGTPKGALSARFPASATIAEVIAFTIEKKELEGGPAAWELFQGKVPLVPVNKALADFGIKNGDKLLLAATGSGV